MLRLLRLLANTYNYKSWLNERVKVLCGKYKQLIGRVVRLSKKARVTHALVCFESLPLLVKLTTNCVCVKTEKLKKLTLN